MDISLENRLNAIAEAHEAGTLSWKAMGGQELARFPRGDGMSMMPVTPAERSQLDALIEERQRLREEVRRLQANPPPDPDADVLARLREHRIVVFEGRIIFDAQPPATQQAIDHIAQKCAAPIPPELLELWSLTLGGTLYYDLKAQFKDTTDSMWLSFMELFYENSPFYRDLSGWMDHELELAQDMAAQDGKSPPTAANFLPFGGFEYLDRAYVRLRDGTEANADYGSVWYWKKALPPAWNGLLKRDSTIRLASSLREFFALLHVDVEQSVHRYGHVRSVMEKLERLKDVELTELVRALYLSASP